MPDTRPISYNPVTGLYIYSAQEDGKEIVGYHQDDSLILETCAEMRKTDEDWHRGVKKELAHYASVPDSIIMKMWIEDKCNFYDPQQKERVGFLINTKYPECKVTTKTHKFRAR